LRKIQFGLSIALFLVILVAILAVVVSIFFLNPFGAPISTTEPFQVLEQSFPGTLLVSSDLQSVNYSIIFNPPANVSGNFSLSGLTPQGISAEFLPTVVSGETPMAVILEIKSLNTTLPGSYSITLSASDGEYHYTENVLIIVIRYLIVNVGTSFLPQNLTVVKGSTVTWLRLNGILSPSDDESHDVDFSSSPSLISPTLNQYESWNFIFTESGDYSYYCKYHPFMTGEIEGTLLN
jgi:hypothetical protein